jgi:hypothetical protein
MTRKGETMRHLEVEYLDGHLYNCSLLQDGAMSLGWFHQKCITVTYFYEL